MVPYIPGSFKQKFQIPFWREFLSEEFVLLLWFTCIPGSFKTKSHIPLWVELISKEHDLLANTVSPVIPIFLWLIWKELQKGN